MATTIRCFYSCSLCRIEKQFVEVPERDPACEDIRIWVEKIAVLLGMDHRSRSLLCPATKLDVGIPVDDATEHVGQKTRS